MFVIFLNKICFRKRKKTVRQTRYRKIREPKESRIMRAQRQKVGSEFTTTSEKEVNEYIQEEDWFSSDEEEFLEQTEEGRSYTADDITFDDSLPSPGAGILHR